MIKNFGIVSIASLKTQGPIPSISNKKFLFDRLVIGPGEFSGELSAHYICAAHW